MKKIVVIDYGLSNLLSVEHAFRYFDKTPAVSQSSKDISEADALILPGVGAFADGMNRLSSLGLIEVIKEKVLSGTPLLGICLGMQMLFDESEEFGIHKGFAFIPGKVVKIPSADINGNKQKIPHISWDPLYPANDKKQFDNPVLNHINIGAECYFIHSYEAKPLAKDNTIAETIYGGRKICALAQNNNVIGMQFHPEKSGEVGLTLLKNFIDIYCS